MGEEPPRQQGQQGQQPGATPEMSDIYQALNEFHVMVRYALAEGLRIDDETQKLVAAIELAKDEAFEAAPAPDPMLVNQLIAAHSALAKAVAPATPRSLEATEPAPGLIGSLARPHLVALMIITGLIAAIGFIATGVQIAVQSKSTAPSNITRPVSTTGFRAVPGSRVQSVAFLPSGEPENPPGEAPSSASLWLKQLNWFFAAALGAVFYVLFTAHEYVKNRTFDPRYNSVYLIRFVLGVLAGLILASLAGAPLLSQNETFRSLGPAVIALLGGFSTEAVYQILQRLVDILLAAVRGDASDAAKAKTSQAAQKELLALAADPAVVASPALLNKIHASIQKLGQ